MGSGYGLPQVGRVASDHLLPRMAEAAFHPTNITPELLKHVTSSVIFALVVDNFLILFTHIADMQLLATTLCRWHTITINMEASKLCGMTLEWDYIKQHCTISMPGYSKKPFNNLPTRHHQNPNIPPTHG